MVEWPGFFSNVPAGLAHLTVWALPARALEWCGADLKTGIMVVLPTACAVQQPWKLSCRVRVTYHTACLLSSWTGERGKGKKQKQNPPHTHDSHLDKSNMWTADAISSFFGSVPYPSLLPALCAQDIEEPTASWTETIHSQPNKGSDRTVSNPQHGTWWSHPSFYNNHTAVTTFKKKKKISPGDLFILHSIYLSHL